MDLPAATRFSKKLAAAGFLSFGGFHPDKDDQVPAPANGKPARTVLMIGSAGQSFWQSYRQTPESKDGKPDPMDRFTRRVLTGLAGEFGLTPLFVFDGPPYYPIQRWALKCGGFTQSPFGLLAHAKYGPWAGLRAAFVSPDHFGTFEKLESPGPCSAYQEKPCLSACPVDAISLKDGYDVPRCLAYLRDTPDAACWAGCLARHACPIGEDVAQAPDHARFHMESFAKLA